ncbi:hypothetical protein V8E36_008880 [Tilletia maclaganii]
MIEVDAHDERDLSPGTLGPPDSVQLIERRLLKAPLHSQGLFQAWRSPTAASRRRANERQMRATGIWRLQACFAPELYVLPSHSARPVSQSDVRPFKRTSATRAPPPPFPDQLPLPRRLYFATSSNRPSASPYWSSKMRYNTILASIILTLLTAVTVKAVVHQNNQNIGLMEACFDHCTSDKTSSPGCVTACDRCTWAVGQGYLPQDNHSTPPSCERHCRHDKDCTAQCQQAQQLCCVPSFGCCPYQAQFCHCRDSDPLC